MGWPQIRDRHHRPQWRDQTGIPDVGRAHGGGEESRSRERGRRLQGLPEEASDLTQLD